MKGAFPDAPPITLIQLATHTSGLGREPDDVAIATAGPVAEWDKALITALPHLKDRRDGYVAFGHGGAVAGYTSAQLMNRAKGIGVIGTRGNQKGSSIGVLSSMGTTIRRLHWSPLV